MQVIIGDMDDDLVAPAEMKRRLAFISVLVLEYGKVDAHQTVFGEFDFFKFFLDQVPVFLGNLVMYSPDVKFHIGSFHFFRSKEDTLPNSPRYLEMVRRAILIPRFP